MRAGHLFMVLLCALPMLLIGPAAAADRAGIPLDPRVAFEEDAQNAIAAWNGTDEVLLLSTDLRSQTPGRLLEMLPLPSLPYNVTAGSTASFKKMIELFNEKAERLRDSSSDSRETGMMGGVGMDEQAYTGIDVEFQASLGAHNLTIVHIEDRTHFALWVRDFAAQMGVDNFTVAYELNASVGEHLRRGISYFVFDVVELGGELKTVEPLVYKFKAGSLYYPLAVTQATLPASAWSNHKIKLFLVMEGVVRDYDNPLGNLSRGAGFNRYIMFSHAELGQVSSDIAKLFPEQAFVAYLTNPRFGGSGELTDVVIQSRDLHVPTADELRKQDFEVAVRPLAPSLAYYLLIGTVDESQALPLPLLVLALAGMVLAPLVIGLVFRSAMEGPMLGRAGWVLWTGLYAVGTTAILGFVFLMGVYESSTVTALMAVSAVFAAPMLVALFVGYRLKMNRMRYRKRGVLALSYGMAAAQIACMFFIPSSAAALMTVIGCFPSTLLLGLIMGLTALARRYDSRMGIPPPQTPYPPPPQSPPYPPPPHG